jgi:hypothetical protein
MGTFYSEELLARRPTPKLEDHPLSAVRDRSFNIFAATLHTGGRSSIRNLRTRQGMVTGTDLSWFSIMQYQIDKHCAVRHKLYINKFNACVDEHEILIL